MELLKRAVRRLDAFQQRHLLPALVLALVRKYGEDGAGALSVQLTYALFLTVFPLLLLLVTVLGLVLSGDAAARERVLHSAFAEFPVVGQQLRENIHAMRRNSAFGLAVGLGGLVYGATGLAQTGLHAMAEVWGIPRSARPRRAARLARSVAFLAVLGAGLVVTTFLSAFGTFGQHVSLWLAAAGEVLAAILNAGLYWSVFRVLTPRRPEARRLDLVPGAVAGGIAWTVLQAFGGYLVGHDLRRASATYGVFGTVLGLVAWIALGAKLTLYAAELNTVLARRLWPRSLLEAPRPRADAETLELGAGAPH
ncbi:MAG TPA: YihY/virulence factor BrkB family protein [Acidimicrobiales bacterium]|nr:YihY/virulence factor BrkB family protein [Acidimicrobiales bacterium]